MAAKKSEQDQDSASMKDDAATRSDATQSTDAVTAASVAPSTPASGEQKNAQDEALVATRSPIVLSPDVSAVVASNLQESDLDKSELPGYRVTDVSSVLHDGTWYHEGDELFLNDKESGPLLAHRIIEPSWSEK